MSRFRGLAVAALVSASALAQNPTATLSGRVTNDGQGLPGVVVTVRSPALQGARTAVTAVSGDYAIPLLPGGDYTVSFEMASFTTEKREIRLSAAQKSRLDVALSLSTKVEAETLVVASREQISTSQQGAVTYSQDTIEKLPIARNITQSVLLAAGTNNSGPGGNVTISGAQSYESLYLINGVVVNENLRGQALNLFIEDAVQETTTSTSGISAEYGRFAGGVVNVLTKSGGNDFSGSFRTSFTNDDWQKTTDYRSPATGQSAENLVDKIVPTYEATLGGPVIKDVLWFFGAGRLTKPVSNSTTAAPVSASVVTGTDQKRYEGKLTLTVAQRHTFLANYQKIDQIDLGNVFPSAAGVYDVDSFNDRETPQELYSGNYTGTLSDNLFVEAQYSNRRFTFRNSGAKFTDLIRGTLMIDNTNGVRYWSPTFCGVCTDERRDNRDLLVKGTYFLSTKSLGSHAIVAGYDHFEDIRLANNHQSGSDYRIVGTGAIIRDGVVYPRLLGAPTGNSTTIIRWTPILQDSQGTSFVTHSAFVNDTWKVTNRLSVNLGLRWDKNDGTDSSGNVTAKDSKFSPRLGFVYDVAGDGGLIVQGYYARYVAGLANNQADAGAVGGQAGNVDFDYRGPSINADPNAPTSTLQTTAQALQTLFDWFLANGGTGRPVRGNPSIPGINPNIAADGLASPSTDELTAGLTKRFGPRALVRLDGIYRKSSDFYGQFVNAGTGTVSGTLAGVTRTFDKTVIDNTDSVERRYYGLNLSFSVRPSDSLTFQGNYTFSRARGNFEGENSASGPVAADTDLYPELFRMSWYAPVGDLSIDRRHKARAWVVWDTPIRSSFLGVNVSLLQSYDAGAPYGLNGTVSTTNAAGQYFAQNVPGYISAPATVRYWFTARDAFKTEDVWRTDLALNISIKALKNVELFLQPEVLNLFNNQAVLSVGSSVRTRSSAGTAAFAEFNPFTDQPVQVTDIPVDSRIPVPTNGHWSYAFQTLAAGSAYCIANGLPSNVPCRFVTTGQASSPSSYQQPRLFRVSVGIRF